MKVTVTEEHIRRGKRGNSRFCPISLAIDELIKPLNRPNVGIVSIYFPDTDKIVDLPTPAWVFRERFDAGMSVEPFSFELEIP